MVIKKTHIICLLLTILVTGSCSSWRRNYTFCKETNWQELGIQDGKDDTLLEEQFARHQRACQHFEKGELKPNFVVYRYGHALGIKTYCAYEQGFTNGKNQKTSSQNCKRKEHASFYKGIQDGVNHYCVYGSGLLEGKKGMAQSRVCSRKAHKEFYSGMEKGLEQYCSYSKGSSDGREGVAYTQNCKGEGEREYLRGVQFGKGEARINQLEQSLQGYRDENTRLKERIEYLESTITSLRTEINNLETQKTSTSTSY